MKDRKNLQNIVRVFTEGYGEVLSDQNFPDWNKIGPGDQPPAFPLELKKLLTQKEIKRMDVGSGSNSLPDLFLLLKARLDLELGELCSILDVSRKFLDKVLDRGRDLDIEDFIQEDRNLAALMGSLGASGTEFKRLLRTTFFQVEIACTTPDDGFHEDEWEEDENERLQEQRLDELMEKISKPE